MALLLKLSREAKGGKREGHPLRLQAWGFGLIDCQMRTDHLISLGAREIPRGHFVALLDRYCPLPGPTGSWDQGHIQSPQIPNPGRRGEAER